MLSNDELIAKVRAQKEFKRMQKEVLAELEVLEDVIKKEMEERNVNELFVDVFTIRWTPVETSRIDTKAIQKELPDIAAKYMNTTTSKRLSIS